MSKIIKYKDLSKKIGRKIHIPVKNIDTVIIENYDDYDIKEEKHSLNIKNIIIDYQETEYLENIKIYKTNAENIYFKNYHNFGGITIPYEMFIHKKIDLKLRISNITSIKEINIILLNNKVKKISFNEFIEKMEVKKDPDNKDNIKLYIDLKKEELIYNIDKNGNIEVEKYKYYIDETNIKEYKTHILNDKVLDLRDYKDYENITIRPMTVNSIIINKSLIENIDKLYSINSINYFYGDIFKFRNLIISEDNNMKLIPNNIIIENIKRIELGNSNEISNYIYIETEDNNEIIIYIDKNNEIKTINKQELFKDNKISNIIYKFDESSFGFGNYIINLIMIKYKNGTYKIIEFDKIYEIDIIFFKLLSINTDKYFSSEVLKEALNEYDFETIFEDENFSNNKLHILYNDYIKYKDYLKHLKELGFNNSAIKYLFDRKFNNLINPLDYELIDTNKLFKEEIDGYNYIGKEYIKQKRLKK